MKSIIKNIRTVALLTIGGAVAVSCNKDPEEIAGATPTVPPGQTIAATLAASPTDSLFYKLVVKANLTNLLSNNSLALTVFAPDNTAMIASGLSNAVINAIPATTAASLVNYNILPQKYDTANFSAAFPNQPVATLLPLDPTNPLVRMNSFPSKRAAQFWVNNVPLGVTSIQASNGVIHKPLAMVAPASRMLKDTMNRVATLSYFKAAIEKADSGQSFLNRFDSLRNYPVMNMTILAPNDAAFQTLIYGLVYAKVMALTGGNTTIANAQATGAVALGPSIFTNPAFYPDLSAANVRGIIAYHILAANFGTGYQPLIRTYSVNYRSTPTFVQTLVNAAFPTHPGVMGTATFTGPVVSNLTFASYGSFPPGGAPFSYTATAISRDQPAVNGIFHIIDKVLLPQ